MISSVNLVLAHRGRHEIKALKCGFVAVVKS